VRALLFFLLLIGLNASAATVYRSVDDKGTVRYTDRPDGENVERVFIRTQRGNTPAAASRPSVAAQNAASNPQSEAEPGLEGEQGPSEEEIQAQREGNCKIAKERLELYVTSRRLYKEMPDGERDYLDDDQLTQAREKAAEDVQKWCN
jgi:hypothetical protein